MTNRDVRILRVLDRLTLCFVASHQSVQGILSWHTTVRCDSASWVPWYRDHHLFFSHWALGASLGTHGSDLGLTSGNTLASNYWPAQANTTSQILNVFHGSGQPLFLKWVSYLVLAASYQVSTIPNLLTRKLKFRENKGRPFPST